MTLHQFNDKKWTIPELLELCDEYEVYALNGLKTNNEFHDWCEAELESILMIFPWYEAIYIMEEYDKYGPDKAWYLFDDEDTLVGYADDDNATFDMVEIVRDAFLDEGVFED